MALEWTAIKSAGGIALSGMAPNEAAKALAKTNAAGVGAGGVLDDGVKIVPVLKPQPDFAEATQFALAQLKALTSGEARLRDTSLSVSGAAANPALKAAVETALKGRLPGGLASASADITVRPYVFQARKDGGAVTLEGVVSDLATKNALLDVLKASDFKGTIRDGLTMVSGAPAGFAEAARLAVEALTKVDDGAARYVDGALSFYGATCKADVKTAAEGAFKGALPQGVTASATVEMKKPAECGSCVQELAQVKGRAILFQQGKDEVADEAGTNAALDQVAAILKTCPAAKIVIEAHTNNDGEARGFDNVGLSRARAEAVVSALVKRGIAQGQLTAHGFGSTRPVAPHGSPGAKEQNRRIDFVVQQ